MEDTKPDIEGDAAGSGGVGEGGETAKETITIRVRDQTGEETYFKIKKTTRMEKVFATYAQRKGVAPNALRFLIDGERITGDKTPKQLELVRPHSHNFSDSFCFFFRARCPQILHRRTRTRYGLIFPCSNYIIRFSVSMLKRSCVTSVCKPRRLLHPQVDCMLEQQGGAP
ncbi:unnamed protein product [Phaeothamnion confervicola]